MRRVTKYQIVEFKTGTGVSNVTVYNNIKDLINGMKKCINKQTTEFDIEIIHSFKKGEELQLGSQVIYYDHKTDEFQLYEIRNIYHPFGKRNKQLQRKLEKELLKFNIGE